MPLYCQYHAKCTPRPWWPLSLINQSESVSLQENDGSLCMAISTIELATMGSLPLEQSSTDRKQVQ